VAETVRGKKQSGLARPSGAEERDELLRWMEGKKRDRLGGKEDAREEREPTKVRVR
jgi:hypothetical protein